MISPWFEPYQIEAMPTGITVALLYLASSPIAETKKQKINIQPAKETPIEKINRYIAGKEIYVCVMALVLAEMFGYSPLMTYVVNTNPSLVFLIYASIYFTVIRFLTTYKVIAACFIMALFEGIMYKAYLNELGHKGLENGLYDNYEAIVALLHVAIIFQMVQWSKLRHGARFLRNNILRPFMYSRLLLPYRG